MGAARAKSRAAAACRCARATRERHVAAGTKYSMCATRAHLRQRTLKRRSSSTYEASGCASITSASSAFSAALQLTASCASCKPTLLCSDGCGAAAVHSVCRGGCGQCTVNAQMTKGVRPSASSATAVPTKSVRACTFRARVRTRRNCLLRWQHAACDKRRTACNMQRATVHTQHPCILRPSHVWRITRDLCRAASCSATGAAQLNCVVMQ